MYNDRIKILGKEMRSIEFKTNYNVLLWHFVDQLSMWDKNFGTSSIETYFKQNFGLIDGDKYNLERYAKLRKPFLYEGESDLFQWAYLGFQTPRKYGKMVPHIKYFENRRDKRGKSLKKILLEGLEYIEELDIADYYEAFLKEKGAGDIIKKISELFEIDTTDDSPVVCFLPYGIGKFRIGGSNGWAIYVEILPDSGPKDVQRRSIFKIVFHEYLHKSLNLREYFYSKNIYEEVKDDVYPGTLAALLEEVIVLFVSHIIIEGVDVDDRVTKFEEECKKNNRILYVLNGWKILKNLQPVLSEYINKPSTDPLTYRKRIYKIFDETIKRLEG